ncbi:hypothetical protein ACJJTC_017877 [Scirpophaga incertulas]
MNKGLGNRWKNVKLNLPQNEKNDKADNALVKKPTSLNNVVSLSKEKERVLYARSKLLAGVKPSVVGGRTITEEEAIELRMICFGTAACPPRGEWVRTPLTMRSPDQPLGYGLAAPRNGARSLLSALQAHIIKWLLFDSRPMTKDNKSALPPETYLRPSEERQEEALWHACSDVIWRCGGGFSPPTGIEPKCIVALPSESSYVQHSSQYYQDGITEKFQSEDSSGALLLLYSAVLSRGCENVKKDLDGKLSYLVSAQVEGSLNVVTLLLTGRATPYLHNGVLYVGDEDHYAMPQYGTLCRSPVGLLVWYGGEENGKQNLNKQYPGSRLKTPAFPIWVTSCSGHYGVLFNTNRELLRNYHAERRFDIHYYTCGGCNVLLNVDTRAQDEGAACSRNDDISATPLEKLIHTKWQDAKITWTGNAPFVSEV